MNVAKWIPADAELDELARSLPGDEPARDRSEQVRTRMLAGAGSVAQQARSSRLPLVVTAGLAFAAAAAAVIWIAGRSHEDSNEAQIAVIAPPAPRDRVVASAAASYERIGSWPDVRVRVREGRVAFEVSAIGPAERYRVVIADAEVEVRGTRFVVEVQHDRLTAVLVEEGRVEVRMPAREPVMVSAEQRWSPPHTAHADPASQEPERVASTAPGVASAPPVTKKLAPGPRSGARVEATPAPPRDRVGAGATTRPDDPRSRAPTSENLTARSGSSVVTPGPTTARPGESEFRRGWSLLRTGDPSGASKAFDSACKDLGADALSEDACFWTGVAAKRAGQGSAARAALAMFITRFPGSSRVTEASALLGWLLYDAGDLAGAEKHFQHASKDRAPKVRTSAERGLEAIRRRRDAAP